MHGVKCKFWHRWMSIDIDHGKMCELDPKMAWNRIVWRWGFLFLVYWRVPGLDRHCLHYCSGPVSQSIDWYGRFIWLNCVRAGKPLFRCDFLFCFFFDHRLLTHNALIQRPNKDGHNLTWGEMQHPATHQLSLFPSVFGFRCLVASCHAKRRLRKLPRSKKQSSTSRGNIKRSMEIGSSGTSNQLTGSLSEVNDWVTSAP